MEDGQVSLSSTPYTDIFEKMCPFMLALGVSLDDFWYGDPHIVKYYIEADAIRKRRLNEQLYLQGLYVYQAIGCFAEILPAFPKKGAKVHPYPEEPFALSQDEADIQKEKEARERMEKIKRKMMSIADRKEV